MLTPIDPLDKLEDLTAEELLVFFFVSSFANADAAVIRFVCQASTWGWIEHFTNKYIICGRLVENDGGES